ncbi:MULTISPECIES: lariocidin/triculamin family lasso peptide core domain [Streptomyces]|nr:hypothetical protein [Streptomyces actinomycinicus]
MSKKSHPGDGSHGLGAKGLPLGGVKVGAVSVALGFLRGLVLRQR